MSKRCAIYVRVSTEEQKKGLSIDSQLEALKAFCKANNYKIAGIYNDAGISARKAYKHRTALLQLLEDIKLKKVDIVAFTKLDRWFRSVADYYEVQKVLDDYNVPWRAIWEDYETETSSGKFKVNIMLSIAQAESDRTSERIKAVFEYKRAQGQYVGAVPRGYKRINGTLTKDPEEAPMIDLMFNKYLLTHSTYKTAEAMKEAGYAVSMSTITKWLKNPAYTGKHDQATYEPFITEEQHKEILNARNKYIRNPRIEGRAYIFSGLLTCAECGGRMEARTCKKVYADGSIHLLATYACHHKLSNAIHKQRYTTCSERKVEKYLIDHIGMALDRYNMDIELSAIDQYDPEEDIKRLNQKLKRIGIRFEDGDIDLEEYRQKRTEIAEKIAELENSKTDTKQPIKLNSDWLTVYEQLDNIHKRAFWKSIVSDIIIESKKDPVIII